MSSILEKMYNGMLPPFGELTILQSDYQNIAQKLIETESELLRQFPDCEKLFSQYKEIQQNLNELSTYAEFEIGFRAGAQLMLEMMNPL